MATDKDTETHADTVSIEKLEVLHERVNHMLDLPLPDETEAWSLRLDTSVSNIPPGHGANGASTAADMPR
jgi:hypothetical protein